MGRSASSCFKILSCNGGGSAEDGDLSPGAQTKASSDKRKWSFRKKSSSHRVLSNNAISEPLSVGSSKESVEVTTNNFQSPKCSSSSEKAPAKERPTVTFSLPAVIVKADKEEYAAVSKKEIPSFQESDAIIIQSYIRGYFARKELNKVKSAIKLQAAVRGHLARKQAVGTLRCVLAIFKMQALVRARQARHLAKKEYSYVKSHNSLLTTEKLLSNGFARQLLESSSATKAINIKCDPSKSDSAWRWLERWVAVTSPNLVQQQEELLNECYQGAEGNKMSGDEKGDEILDDVMSLSSDAVLAPGEPAMQTENTSLTAEHVGNSELNNPIVWDNSINFSVENVANSQAQNEDLFVAQESHTKTEISDEEVPNSFSGCYQLQEPHPTFQKLENVESTSPQGNAKNVSPEVLELEGKKYPQGSRRTINPAFAAVQSKFEELSSTYSVSRSNGSSYQDIAVKIKSERHNEQTDFVIKNKDICSMDNTVFHDPRVQVAASECGTEISISSTLDSPDRSETEGGEIVLEIGVLEKEKYAINTDTDSTLKFSHMESKEDDSNFKSGVHTPQDLVDRDDNLGKSVAALTDPTEQTPDRRIHLESVTDDKVRTSPSGTPRSQTTASDFHGTPSSQVSVNTKKNKKDSNLPTQKQRSLLGGKKSPANSGNDSGGRSSIEQLPKNAKRRNSLGIAKSDSVDQEPRLSSSSSLPSYMQATVSARAKLHSNVSPKLSPDVHESNTKKRHSLPIENGKQGSSPRMQRSASQAQQNSKVNGTHSPNNTAERRWQR